MTSTSIKEVKNYLKSLASAKKASASRWFFKTGKGQYGEGDKFIGISVPKLRSVAKKFKNLQLDQIQELLNSEIHEERFVALLILINQFKESMHDVEKEYLFRFYLKNLRRVNNWDLVDLSADKIVGEFLRDKKITLLLSLAKSQNLWERRIAVVATFAFIKNSNSKPTYSVCDLLLSDREDLIQKAVGWMLRECGKRVDETELEKYIMKNYSKLGRTALRYAIERFEETKRIKYLNGDFK